MPRTLAQNAQYIAETIKPAIKSAIEAQGVTVPSTDSFLDYADRIGEIEGGGSGYQLKDLPTGSIATVNDAASLPLNALKVSVEAWQEGSGDPSPSNVRPIIGWDSGEIWVVGKNILPQSMDTNNGFRSQYALLPDGSLGVDAGLDVSEFFEVPSNGKIILSGLSGYGRSYCFYDKDKNYVSGDSYQNRTTITANVPANAVFTRITLVHRNSATQSTSEMVKITTATTLTFPTTIYGAEWDVVGGELKQTKGYIGSLGADIIWQEFDTNLYIAQIDAVKRTDTDYLCSCYKSTNKSRTELNDGESTFSSGTGKYLWVRDDRFSNVQDFATAIRGQQLVFTLETPTTIQLSPLSIRLLEGTNNIYADCGEVIEGEYFSGDNQLYANGIIFAGKGDSGIGSYRKIDTLPTALLNASAMTCEVCARFDSFVNLSSGPYARIITFGNDNQTGRFGVIGVAYDGSSTYDLCVWDDTIDLSSGLYEWTPTDTHTVAVVKTTAGAIKIYVDGVLKYTGSSALTITNTLIDYICQRSRYNASYDTQRQINGEIFAWRVYGKELSASQINANFLVDKINYID